MGRVVLPGGLQSSKLRLVKYHEKMKKEKSSLSGLNMTLSTIEVVFIELFFV